MQNNIGSFNSYNQIINLINTVATTSQVPSNFAFTRDSQQELDVVWATVVCSDFTKPMGNIQLINTILYNNNVYNDVFTANVTSDEYVACSGGWPSLSKPLPPANLASTPPPVLIISNYHDPQTPYANGVDLQAVLPNSKFLIFTGGGHCAAYRNVSKCIDNYTNNYLLTGNLPSNYSVCYDVTNTTGADFITPQSKFKVGRF